jgi:hypothetical protein
MPTPFCIVLHINSKTISCIPMGTRFVLNNKTIWDNVEFEHLLFSESLGKPDSYLPVKQIDSGVVSIGGWKIDVQSAIDSIATPLDIIDGYGKLSSKLKLETHKSFLPFFTADIWNYRPYIARNDHIVGISTKHPVAVLVLF